MTKKNRKKTALIKIFENTEIESAEPKVEATEPTTSEVEAVPLSPVASQEHVVIATSEDNIPVIPDELESPPSDSHEEKESSDELLDDVRRSLLEEESQKEDTRSKSWWRRKSKGKSAEVKKPVEAEMEMPAVSASADLVKEDGKETESDEYLGELDELIEILETETIEDPSKNLAPVEAAKEPEVKVDLEELKKQAFQTRAGDEKQEDFSEIRSIALQGGEEVFVEVQSTRQDAFEERVTGFENALRPYRRYIYVGIAVLGVFMAVTAGIIVLNLLRSRQPPPPTEGEVIVPYPTSMSLPGGLIFSLGKGTLEQGEWNPRGPEWLEGTEICRWFAIPWSRQLEAVIRTLNPDDPIELTMSNNDRLVYKVYSVRQLSNEELQKVDANSPCLLLVLAEADSDTRWVLVALP